MSSQAVYVRLQGDDAPAAVSGLVRSAGRLVAPGGDGLPASNSRDSSCSTASGLSDPLLGSDKVDEVNPTRGRWSLRRLFRWRRNREKRARRELELALVDAQEFVDDMPLTRVGVRGRRPTDFPMVLEFRSEASPCTYNVLCIRAADMEQQMAKDLLAFAQSQSTAEVGPYYCVLIVGAQERSRVSFDAACSALGIDSSWVCLAFYHEKMEAEEAVADLFGSLSAVCLLNALYDEGFIM